MIKSPKTIRDATRINCYTYSYTHSALMATDTLESMGHELSWQPSLYSGNTLSTKD
jgi:hypothetical protein